MSYYNEEECPTNIELIHLNFELKNENKKLRKKIQELEEFIDNYIDEK